MSANCKLPPDYKRHAITFLSFYGKEKLSTQENLFEAIQKFPRRFVVDNNIDWPDLSTATENVDTAFILGTTADMWTAMFGDSMMHSGTSRKFFRPYRAWKSCWTQTQGGTAFALGYNLALR